MFSILRTWSSDSGERQRLTETDTTGDGVELGRPHRRLTDTDTTDDGVELGRPSLDPEPSAWYLRRVLERPLARTEQELSGGFHSWTVVMATAPGANPCVSAALLILSIMLLAVQSNFMVAVAYESAYSSCTDHQDCPTGEWCVPAGFMAPIVDRRPLHAEAPGVCGDCHYSNLLEFPWANTSFAVGPGWFDGDEVQELSGDKWQHDGAAYCNNTDTIAMRCDHIVKRQSRLTTRHIFVLIIVALLILIPLTEDWDEAALEKSLFQQRTRGLSRWSLLRALMWVSLRMRLFILPLNILSATLALFLQDETITDLVLDGLAITFMTYIDNLVALFCLPRSHLRSTAAAIAVVRQGEGEAASGSADARRHFMRWLFHRVYAAVMGVTLIVISIQPEALMVAINAYGGVPICDSIIDTIYSGLGSGIHLPVVLAMAGSWAIVRERSFVCVSYGRQLAFAACDAYFTMFFVYATTFLNPADPYALQFLQDPMSVVLRWPQDMMLLLSFLFAEQAREAPWTVELEGAYTLADDVVPKPDCGCVVLSSPWLVIRLSLLAAVVCLVVVRVRVSSSVSGECNSTGRARVHPHRDDSSRSAPDGGATAGACPGEGVPPLSGLF